jgi:RNA polymerase sigma-70 factor (ECF subfamily)
LKVINLHQQEKEMIQLAIDNNRAAQQNLFSIFSKNVICRMYVKDVHQAEDVMITS